MVVQQPDLFGKLLSTLTLPQALNVTKYFRFLPRTKLALLNLQVAEHVLLGNHLKDLSSDSKQAILSHFKECLTSIEVKVLKPAEAEVMYLCLSELYRLRNELAQSLSCLLKVTSPQHASRALKQHVVMF